MLSVRVTVCLAALLSASCVFAAETSEQKSLGFVVTSLRTAIAETQYLEECPEGMAIGNDEIWWKSLPLKDRDRLTEGGEKEPSSRRILATLRGPKGEDVCWNPASVIDPPMRVIQSKLGIGLNLDGTSGGEKTAQSCRHDKFTSADGATAVDNQMARVVGCIHGWRSGGYIEAVSDTERRDMSKGLLLLEVVGAKDVTATADVTVKVWRANDVMPKDAHGDILPYASYRVSDNRRYGATLRGHLEKGVLTTEPMDVTLPFYGNRVETEFFIRGLRLNLKLTDDRGEGLLAGYHDLDNWWDYVRKMGYLVETAQFSCPALYAAAHKLADGYPNAEGECSALSAAYKLQAVRAFIIHPKTPTAPIGADNIPAVNAAKPNGFSTHTTALGTVLSDHSGKTLYVNVEGCLSQCGNDFEPIMAPWIGASLPRWSVVTRGDGLKQWAIDGKPLYACTRDPGPGAANCGGKTWQVVVLAKANPIPAELSIQESELGPIVANQAGHAVYRFIGAMDKFKTEICNDACMGKLWHTVAVTRDAVAQGSWTIIEEHGVRIWALRGKPVYVFAGDEGPGQIAGHRFGGASVGAQNWFSAIKQSEFFDDTPPNSGRRSEATPTAEKL